MKNKIVNLVPHTHWDREWYFSINDSTLLSTYNFEKVLDTLENDSEFKAFHLDGQTSIIEDVLEFKPELEPRIRKLVQEKRLFIGPWYTQTDSFYVDGESYIRNLYFGIKKADELGGTMKIGYLPDTFGHNIQTPQMFKGFGIDNVLFWRGFDEEKIASPYFNWKSIDGSEVLGVNLTFGYGAAKWMTDKQEEWDNKIIPMADKISSMIDEKNILLPSGGDQVLIDTKLPESIKKLNEYSTEYEFKMSTYEDFVRDLKEEITELETHISEFRDPIKARVHRTIGSSRYDIKKKSFEIEHKLVNILEPLSIIIADKVDKKLLNLSMVEKSWKLLLDGHAHDSLGACNTDITNENIMNRFKRAENLIDGMINIFKKTIALNLNEQYNEELLLFNFDSKVQNEWKEVTLFSRSNNIEILDGQDKVEAKVIELEKLSGGKKIVVTPDGDKEVEIDPYFRLRVMIKPTIKPFGYKLFKVNELTTDELNTSNETKIENELLSFEVNGNEFKLVDKKTSTEIENFIKFENVANDGDSYDFSPMKNDNPITNIKVNKVSKNSNETVELLKVEFEVEIPATMIGRDKRSTELVKQEFSLEALLIENEISFKVNTINKAKDHRFRILIDTSINEKVVTTDVPFGFLRREFEDVPSNWKERMVEQPVNYFPIINTFFKQNQDRTITFNTKGMKEIELLENGDIGLTMYKSDEFLGKDDLEFRPNRASGINNTVVKTPDAQLFDKELEFEFNVNFTKSKLTEKEIFNLKRNYLSKSDYYQVQDLNTTLNRLERFQLPINKYQLDREVTLLESNNLELMASYISYKDNKKVYRYLNINDEVANLQSEFNLDKFNIVNFSEEATTESTANKYKLVTVKENE